MKRRLLIEQDIDQLDDFRKILLLNKKKLNIDDIEFYDKNGEDYRNIIEVTPHGLLFHFDDLEQFLKFFFPQTYEEGSEGEWDAKHYDLMYYGRYDFSERCYDSEDWNEGYFFGYFCDKALLELKSLINIFDPSLANYIVKDNNGRVKIKDDKGFDIATLLNKYFPRIDENVSNIVCEAKSKSVSEGATELMEKYFCNGLHSMGIENWSKNYCFRTYFITWGNLVQMYVESGDFTEPLLDVLFAHTELNFKKHPPIYYEIEYDVWNEDIFQQESCERLTDLFEGYIEDAIDEYDQEYIEIMQKLNKVGLLTKKSIPGTSNLWIQALSVDPETKKVKYKLGTGSWMSNTKYGESTVDEVISIATQPGLFDPTEFRIDPNQRKT